jgi:hypothetical protein
VERKGKVGLRELMVLEERLDWGEMELSEDESRIGKIGAKGYLPSLPKYRAPAGTALSHGSLSPSTAAPSTSDPND